MLSNKHFKAFFIHFLMSFILYSTPAIRTYNNKNPINPQSIKSSFDIFD
jgi:hypothetical protein